MTALRLYAGERETRNNAGRHDGAADHSIANVNSNYAAARTSQFIEWATVRVRLTETTGLAHVLLDPLAR